MPQFLATTDPDFEPRFAALLAQKREADADVDAAVAAILAEVAAHGDQALIALTERFDRLRLTPGTLAFSEAEIDAAVAAVAPDDRAALELAAARIRAYHERQVPADARWTDAAGAELGWRWTPVAAAGLYVPGGLASYPSSVLMNAIPARVAGVERLVICAPTPDGAVNPLVLLASRLAGVATVYRIGGAQAIAALAYGTETIAAVDKIAGPGNAYVAAAKRRVFGRVGIDMIAGPSEVLILADAGNDPDWLALDLLAQAEHDTQRPVDPRHRRRRLRPGGRRRRRPPPRHARPPRHRRRQLARFRRRPHRRRAGTRRSPSSTASPPSTCRSAPPTPRRWPRASATPARSSSAPGPPRRSATTSAARTTCCRPPARRASPRASRCSTS